MRAVVLDAMARHGPNLFFEIKLGPAHPRHFVAALRGEQEKPEQGPERPADFIACGQEPPQLVIPQYAIPGPLFRRSLHAVHWRDRKAILLDCPIGAGQGSGWPVSRPRVR